MNDKNHQIDRLCEPDIILRLLTGIVHEVNTPLSIAKANLQLLQMNLDNLSDNHAMDFNQEIEPIERAIKRINGVTQFIMALLDDNKKQLSQVKFSQILFSAIQSLSHRHNNPIQVDYSGFIISSFDSLHDLCEQEIKNDFVFEANAPMIELCLFVLLENILTSFPADDNLDTILFNVDIRSSDDFYQIRLHENTSQIVANHSVDSNPFFDENLNSLYSGKELAWLACQKIIADHGGSLCFQAGKHLSGYEIKLPILS